MNKREKQWRRLIRELNDENRKTFNRLRFNLQSRNLNRLSLEELLDDIAGMALECQGRGESLQDNIGMEPELFCRELARNSPRESWMERILDALLWSLWCICLLIPAIYLIKLIPGNFSPARLDGLHLIAPAAFIIKYLAFALIALAGVNLLLRNNFKPKTVLIGLYAASLIACFLFFDHFSVLLWDGTEWKISVPIWILIFAALIVAAFFAKRLTTMTVVYRKAVQHRSRSWLFKREK